MSHSPSKKQKDSKKSPLIRTYSASSSAKMVETSKMDETAKASKMTGTIEALKEKFKIKIPDSYRKNNPRKEYIEIANEIADDPDLATGIPSILLLYRFISEYGLIFNYFNRKSKIKNCNK
jgi:hypothetical protein